ncbi:MAG: TetR/AcrR family transcriptional regulator [Gammaproteobacteria bacterium]|nr:TetR/AcrR family transcriptional regulator [Gammaproteobacteria bacterium]
MSRDKVLQSAAELIAELGEAHVRLVDVADRSGLSIGAIQHHFRSRDRLVAEAQLERFVGPAQADVEAIDTMLSSAGSVAEVRDVLSLITRAVVDRSRTLQRMDRLSSLSAAHGRPDVYEAVQAQVSELSEQFAGAIRGLQLRGLVRGDVDPTALAVFVQAYALGMVIADLVEPAVPSESLAAVVDLFMDAVLPEPSG